MPRPLRVLVVEDDPGDVLLIEEAFASSSLQTHLDVVSDGQAAVDFLRRQPPDFETVQRPDLVLLDLNLPRLSGTEVLEQTKADPDLCEIPIVVFSTSAAQADVSTCYRSHANAFVTKPTDFDDFLRTVRAIDGFFADVAVCPSRT